MTSPAKIAEYMQVSVITVRRTLTLFNQLGVTHSVNGVGTRILGAENSMDVSNPDDSEILVSSTMETFGKLVDILVNNAGARDEGLRPVDKEIDSEIDRVVGINTKGVMYCTRAVLKDMLKNKKGVIVSVASSSGLSGGPDNGPVCRPGLWFQFIVKYSGFPSCHMLLLDV